MGILMKSDVPGLSMADPAFDAMYSGANVQPRSAVGGDFFGDDVVTGTETPTTTTPSVDVGQLYAEWASSNPNHDPAAAFAAGMDAALGKNNPIGLGMQDDFSMMPGMQPDVLSEVDTFGGMEPDVMSEIDSFSPEGQINKGSWRDTVIDISDVGPPSGA